MVMVPGREMTDEELLEARGQSSGMQRASTLDALNAMAAAAPQAAPAPPPEPINVPPMLERPMGTIPEALARPSGEVIHPRDQALIDRFKRFQQTTLPAQEQARMVVPEMLKRMPEVQAPRTAEGMVLDKFGGSMAAYNKWWNSLPQGMKPRSWDQALGMVSSPEALGVPKAAPKPAVQQPVAAPSIKGIRLSDGKKDDGSGLLHPVAGNVYRSSSAGVRGGRAHKGDDYAPLVAGEKPPLVAMTDGKVISAKDNRKKQYANAAGHRIEVEYGSGKDAFRVRYFHLDKPPSFKVNGKVLTGDALNGKAIKRGTALGIMGDSGASDGVHLHAELFRPDPKTGKFNYKNPHDLDLFMQKNGKISYKDSLLPADRASVRKHRPGHKASEDAYGEVMGKYFNNKMSGKGSYNEWYNSRPANKKPKNYAQALIMLEDESEAMMMAPM